MRLSNSNFLKLLTFAILLLILITVLLPLLLKAMPSRYVARMPAVVQVLGERGSGAPTLPTAASPINDPLNIDDSQLIDNEHIKQTSVEPSQIPTAIPTTDLNNAFNSKLLVSPTATLQPLPTTPQNSRLNGITHHFQTWNNCGPATTTMALSYFDLNLSQSETSVFLKPNPEDRNVSPHEIVQYVNDETHLWAISRTNGNLELIKRLLANGNPVIIELGIEPPGEYRWLGWYGHYLLIVAYSDTLEQFWVYDSWFGTSDTLMENASPEGRIISFEQIDHQWEQFNRNYIVFSKTVDDPMIKSIIGDDIDDDKMWKKSLDRSRKDLIVDPNNPFLWFNLGTALTQQGAYKEAALAFDKAREIGLPWRMLWYQFAPYEAYFQIGRYQDVLLLTNVTLEDRPYFEESFYYRGLAYEKLGNDISARHDFNAALAFNPNFQPAYEALQAIDK